MFTYAGNAINVLKVPPSYVLLSVILILIFSIRAEGVVIDKIAAIVNEDVITQSEVEAIGKLETRLSGLPRVQSMLQERIDFHLALQQLKNQPPVLLTDDEVQSAFDSIRFRYGSEEDLLDFLNSIGMSREELLLEIRNQLSIRKFIRDRFRPFVNITLEDAEDYYEKVYKPAGEMLAKEVPPFAEVFSEIQNLLVESKIQDRIAEWLQELRKTARINIKE